MHTLFKRGLGKGWGAFLSLICVGLLLYTPTLNTPFRWDDVYQIVRTPLMHSLRNVPLFFFISIREAGSRGVLFDYFYRPIPFVLYCLFYVIGHGQSFIFHLFQLGVHIANSFLVWRLFRRFVSWQIAYFLSFLFLIHPINQQAVVYIANLPDILFFFFGCAGLLLATSTTASPQRSVLFVSGLLFLLSILSKETGVLFLGLLLLYGYLFSRQMVSSYFRLTLVVLGVALTFRLLGSVHYYLVMHRLTLSPPQKFQAVPILFLSYLKEMFFPSQTITIYSQNVPAFSSGEVAIAAFASLFIVSGSLMWINKILAKKLQPVGYFFFAWSISGVLFYLQLITLDQFSANRWMYFPLGGVLGMVGVLVEYYCQQSFYRWVFWVVGIGVLTFFIYQTITLNSYWSNEILLLRHSR